VPSIVQLLIPALALPGFLLATESPRWLCAKDRATEERAFLIHCHAGNDEASPLVQFQLEEIDRTLRLERELSVEAGYMDMIRTKGNDHHSFISVTMGIFSNGAPTEFSVIASLPFSLRLGLRVLKPRLSSQDSFKSGSWSEPSLQPSMLLVLLAGHFL
jgi:hypothetical protein